MPSSSKKIFYIIGAGSAGISLFHDIKSRFPRSITIFLDDDEKKAGSMIENVPVMGPIEKALSVLNPTPQSEVIIAMPSAQPKEIQRIYRLLKGHDFSKIKILPSPLSYLETPHLVQTQEINLEDLLSRETIKLPNKQALSYLQDKRILITGAGGSIGSELAIQLLYAGVSRMYLLGHGEHSIYKINKKLQELQQRGVGERTNFIPVPCELTDCHAVQHTISKLKADVIFHTAAYKHIDMVEQNAAASTANNVFGTKFLLDAAKAHGVKRFVLVSTDKAVEPTSVYGASKLISEQLTLASGSARMKTSVMRFGNVIGSRGSVVPLFQEQIMLGGPITITSPECKRYFMTLSEACSLMLYAMQLKKESSSALYALEMGKQVSIMEIAQQMLDFYGLEKDKDISFSFTGLRAGEKLTENLLAPGERKKKSPIKHVYFVTPDAADPAVHKLDELLDALYPLCFYTQEHARLYRDNEETVRVLKKHIPSFTHTARNAKTKKR